MEEWSKDRGQRGVTVGRREDKRNRRTMRTRNHH